MALDLRFDAADEAFREPVRACLAEDPTEDPKAAARRPTTVFADRDVALCRQRILQEEKRWAAPPWPKESGGSGRPPPPRHVFAEERGPAGAPGLVARTPPGP